MTTATVTRQSLLQQYRLAFEDAWVSLVIAFGVSLTAAIIGILYLPIDLWQRGFLGITLLFLTSSTFTLAKVVRDRQELGSVRARIDTARVDKLIAEHDPYTGIS